MIFNDKYFGKSSPGYSFVCQIVSNACKLEIFDKMASMDGPCTAVELAEKQGWHADNCRRLLDSLTSLSYIDKRSHDGKSKLINIFKNFFKNRLYY